MPYSDYAKELYDTDSNAGRNVIPGSEAVGQGCNLVTEPYVAGGGIACLGSRRIFDLGKITRQWENTKTGITYDVPEGLGSPGAGNQNISMQASSSLSEFTEKFKAQAGVKGNYKLFSAQADVSYKKNKTKRTESSYAQVEQNAVVWTLRLDSTKAKRTPVFDQAVAELPNNFNPADFQNARAFFEFFELWGTHYLIEADVGGKLYYFAELEDVGVMQDTKLEANISAEFKALVASAKAEASLEWKKVENSWISNRKSHIMTVGPGH